MSALIVDDVSKSYGKIPALSHVSFECQEGEFYTLFGPSGAGKTTILELVAGIKTGYSGRLSIKGRSLESISIQDRNVAMAFEDYALYPHLTIGENIAFPLHSPRAPKIGSGEIMKKVQWIADELGIGHLLERNPVQLSGGQKQRVSLARALVREADVYLLDEPIAHLDANLRTIARANLKAMAHNLGATILYVTHDFREALGLSDRLLILNKGKVLQIGSPRDVYHHPATDYVGWLLGNPAMNLVDGQLMMTDRGPVFKTTAATFHLEDPLLKKAEQRLSSDKKITRLGIRPGGVSVQAKDPGGATALPIYTIEQVADYSLVYFEIGGVFFGGTAKDDDGFVFGQSVWVKLEAGQGYFFDATFDLATPTMAAGIA